MTLAAMAQVPGIYGQLACAAGVSQKNTSTLTTAARPVVSETSATFIHTAINAAIRNRYRIVAEGRRYPYTIWFAIRKADGTGNVSKKFIATIASSSVTTPNLTVQTGSTLTANTKYVLAMHTDKSAFDNTFWPNSARIDTQICFKTAPSEAQMSRPLGWHNDVQRFASGCFAFGGTPEQERACFCGARNTAGTWKPNDTADGFSYLVDANTRSRLGCNTN